MLLPKRKAKKKSTIKAKLHKAWSLKVRERDKFQCQICGDVNKANHAHHIISKGTMNVRGNQSGHYLIENGICLCVKDHTFGIHLKTDRSFHARYNEAVDRVLESQGYTYERLEMECTCKSRMTQWQMEIRLKELK